MASQLRYPLQALHDHTDYLKINIVNYTPIGKAVRGRNKLHNKSTASHIFLPIPSNIQDSNSVNWGESSLDGFTASILDPVIRAMDDTGNLASEGRNIVDTFTGTAEIGKDLLKDLGSNIATGDALKHFTRGLAAQAANMPFGGNLTASQLLARTQGMILNPNMELLFNAPTIRSFKFSFKMTPRNNEEAKHIKDIIRTFKKNMVPQVANSKDTTQQYAGGLYLRTPNIFELTYMQGSGPHPFLHTFKQCALTNMGINYTGDGVYSTYGEGTPVSMIMDLAFKELEPIYSSDYESQDDYANSEGSMGVGF